MQKENLISAEDFCLHHEVEIKFIYSLQEFGLIELIQKEETWFLSPDQLQELEKMVHLHYDLDVNMEGIDVITHLLRKLENTQHELSDLKKQLRFYET